MKLKLFNFTKSNLNRNINYNPPLKNIANMPNNMLIKKEVSTEQKLVKISELLIKILAGIAENNKKISAQIKLIGEKSVNLTSKTIKR